MPDQFIDVIRNQLAVTQLGARTMEGLPAGNIEIPRRTSGATAYFIAGDGDDSVTESTGSSLLPSMPFKSPKSASACT